MMHVTGTGNTSRQTRSVKFLMASLVTGMKMRKEGSKVHQEIKNERRIVKGTENRALILRGKAKFVNILIVLGDKVVALTKPAELK